jgi:creatinine amidohydrolase
MTYFFLYDTLFWTEVQVLPRSTPLLLPLGPPPPEDWLAAVLDYPERIGLLPPIPFGWRGSGLGVPEPVLASMLANLLDSLRDDGFTQVYALTPQGLDLGLGSARIAVPGIHPVAWLPGPDERQKVVLIPIGHTEQHAFHLPLSTDTLIIEAVAQGTARKVPERAVALPVMPYGVSTHRRSFAGTLNAGGRAFEDFWLAIVETLVGRGFDRIYLLSGHGGNCSFLVNVVKYAGDRYPQIFCATAWLYLSGPDGVAALENHRLSRTGGMGHACEMETSLILHLRPDLVAMERVVDETDFISTPSYYMDWVEGGALVANPPWDDDTRTGAYGAGSLATAEHGKIWLEAAVAEKVQHVAEIREQYRRRTERRRSRMGAQEA